MWSYIICFADTCILHRLQPLNVSRSVKVLSVVQESAGQAGHFVQAYSGRDRDPCHYWEGNPKVCAKD